MIFNLWSRVVVKVGAEESHVFDRARLMYTEVAEIERVTNLSYGEWEQALGKYSITAIAALLHVLRIRDGQKSDFLAMQFNAAELDVVPLKDDGAEYTPQEATAELVRRMNEATDKAEGGPTQDTAAVAPEESGSPPDTTITSLPSPESSASAAGNGRSSHGRTSSSTKRTSTVS